MSEYFDLIASALVLGGLFFCFIGALGLIRLPDFYTRCHAAGITDTLGAGMVLLGLMFLSTDPMVQIKLILVAVFLLLTSPTSCHAMTHAAFTRGQQPWAQGDAPDGGIVESPHSPEEDA